MTVEEMAAWERDANVDAAFARNVPRIERRFRKL
jgi:hypothetical protein